MILDNKIHIIIIIIHKEHEWFLDKKQMIKRKTMLQQYMLSTGL